MKNKLLVLNIPLSGLNKYLFGALGKYGWAVDTIDIPVPNKYRYLSMLKTFRFNKVQWRWNFYKELGRYIKTPKAFRERTLLCEKNINQFNGSFNYIFQIGGLFAPSLNGLDKPYVTFNDYTMKLAQKRYGPWAPFKNQKEADEWFELETKLYKNATKIFTSSENTKSSIVQDYGIEPSKVFAVGEGLNFAGIPEVENREYDGKTILFLGRDFKRKGGFVLLEAFKKLREKIKDSRLIIAGQEEIEADIEGVEWIGAIKDRKTIQDLFLKSSILVMPSFCEPFGLVFLEAMAYKLPCIGTRIDAMPEIIEEGKTGLLVEVDNAEELARNMFILLKDRQLMKEMGEAGFERFKNNFTWDKVAGKIHNELINIA